MTVPVGESGTDKSRLLQRRSVMYLIQAIIRLDENGGTISHQNEFLMIIDDFYGWLAYDELLWILDRYPY